MCESCGKTAKEIKLERKLAAATTTIAELKTEIAYQNKQIARLQEDLNKKTGRGQ